MKISPVMTLQNILSVIIKPVLYSLILMLFGAGFVVAAEIDDSSLFVEAFSAYQKKDYLLTIEKLKVIDLLFPDTPLRDVALLLQSRAALRSGDNELAATAINRFNSEFPAHPLKATIEEELLRIGNRLQKGEKLSPAIPLRSAAQTIRSEQMERERIVTQKTIEETVRASISTSGDIQSIAAGQRGEIPFEVCNLGSFDEVFLLENSSAPEYEPVLSVSGRPDDKLARVTIGTAASISGIIRFRMPPDKIDGYKATISLQLASEKDPRVVQTLQTQVIASAPLVRVVTRTDKQKLTPGEKTRYRITVLNAGSLPAVGYTVRLLLPAQIELVEQDTHYVREASGGVIFSLGTLHTGKLAEFTMDVKIREDSHIGQELRSRVEVINNQLHTTETSTSAVAVIQAN